MSLMVGPVGHALGQVVPLRLLLGAEVRAVEELLQAEDLAPSSAPPRSISVDVLVDHRLLDRGKPALGRQHVPGLDESAAHRPGHTTRLLGLS